MSPSPTDQFLQQLDGPPLQRIAQRLQIAPTEASAAIGAAMPLLLAAFGQYAAQPLGVLELFRSLQRSPGDGGFGALLDRTLDGEPSRQTDGAGILHQILGMQLPGVEQALAQSSGLGSGKAGELLRLLAPLAMAFVGARTFGPQSTGRDASGVELGEQYLALGQPGADRGFASALQAPEPSAPLTVDDLLGRAR